MIVAARGAAPVYQNSSQPPRTYLYYAVLSGAKARALTLSL